MAGRVASWLRDEEAEPIEPVGVVGQRVGRRDQSGDLDREITDLAAGLADLPLLASVGLACRGQLGVCKDRSGQGG